MTDPVQLTADLIRCPSVTPEEGGAITLLEKLLSDAGFRTHRPDRNGIANLYAVWGETGPTLGFNGHTDVVPTGDENAWDHPPFGAEIHDGIMFGRGAQDMKSGDAAFVAAAIEFVQSSPPKGRIAIAITGDEEGDGVDGTKAILDWMDGTGEKIDHCIVGEPTCPAKMGEMIKIGRRGSITAYLTATGTQGHSAYPHKANNPIPAMVHLLDRFASMELDQGTDHFDPSTLAITSVDVGNPANNVIPSEIRAMMNIRFNDRHSSDSLSDMIRAEAALMSGMFGIEIDVKFRVTGESFITEPGPFVELVANAVEAVTGVTPELSTTGGTSDARYIKNHCPVVEFGLVGNTMHQVNERVPVEEITTLRDVYARVLKDYFRN